MTITAIHKGKPGIGYSTIQNRHSRGITGEALFSKTNHQHGAPLVTR